MQKSCQLGHEVHL